MRLEHSPSADAAYVYLTDRKIVKTRELDSQRITDYDDDGEIVGIEFLTVSRGVDLSGLPQADQIARLFGDQQIRPLG